MYLRKIQDIKNLFQVFIILYLSGVFVIILLIIIVILKFEGVILLSS